MLTEETSAEKHSKSIQEPYKITYKMIDIHPCFCYNLTMEMQMEKQKLHQMIDMMPDSFTNDIIEYIQELEIIDDNSDKIPEDFDKFIEKGMNDATAGRKYSLAETISMLRSYRITDK